MPNQKFKPIFERTLSEQLVLIRPQVKKVQMENLSKGLYNVYRDSRYKSKNILVRKYKYHKEIIQIDSATGNTQTIKITR